jgi:hypothetical protein
VRLKEARAGKLSNLNKSSVKSKKHDEDMQARRQWKMAMGISAVGDEDGPALSDSE